MMNWTSCKQSMPEDGKEVLLALLEADGSFYFRIGFIEHLPHRILARTHVFDEVLGEEDFWMPVENIEGPDLRKEEG